MPKSRVTEDQLADHYRYVRSDLKRWLTIAPAMFFAGYRPVFYCSLKKVANDDDQGSILFGAILW
jgi:hypothetical protein